MIKRFSFYIASFALLILLTKCNVKKTSLSDSALSNQIKVGLSLVDTSGLVLTDGKFGNLINGQSFQQDVLASYKGWQYIIYYNTDRNVCLGRRKLPDGVWQIIKFKDYHFSSSKNGENDSHNTASLGLCPNDGTIHLAFDHHRDELHYRISNSDVLSHPELIKWDASLFSPVRNYLEENQTLTSVTYPRFITTLKGDMLVEYRFGGSGHGDTRIGYYDGSEHKWKNIHTVISGKGIYKDPFNGDSEERNAYLNSVNYDDKGQVHISWTWRERVSGTANRDICHIYSKDDGDTWYNYKKEIVADRLSNKVVDTNTPNIQIRALDRSWGMMNNGAQTIDHNGILHAVMYHLKEKRSSPVWVRLNTGAYFHYYRDENGMERELQLPATGNRPKLLVDKENNLYLVFVEKDPFDRTDKIAGFLKVLKATSQTKWTDWKEIFVSKEKYFNEVMVDLDLWQKSQTLSVMVQDKPESLSAVSAPIEVIDFK